MTPLTDDMPLPPGATTLDVVEQLVALGLERAMVEGESGIEAVCREHPLHAPAIRARIAGLREMGLGLPVAPSGNQIDRWLGDFRLLRCIGRGGMGEVFIAEQVSLGRRVALKLMRPESLLFDDSRERFRREVESVARLSHAGIVPVYAVGEADGVPYFAMELIEGCSLADALHQLRDLPPERLTGEDLANAIASAAGVARSPRDTDSSDLFRGTWSEVCLRLCWRVAEAMQHAHQHGIVHRDVKPSNIMLTPQGRVLLLDFGLARTDGPSTLTLTRSPLGSLPYVSPEQLRGDDSKVDHRTDIYGLGVTLYELLTLRVPYLAQSNEETRRLTLAGNPTRVRAYNSSVPWDAETICLVAMDRDRERRYATAADLARDASRALQFLPITARRPGLALKTYRWAQRHPRLSVAAVLLPTALIALSYSLGGWFKSEALAADRLTEVYRLADARLATLMADRALELWPAQSEKVPAMTAWLAEAHALAARLAGYRNELEQLRLRALPYDAESQQHDRESHPRGEDVAAMRTELESLLRSPDLSDELDARIDAKQGQLEALERDVNARRTWRFAQVGDQRAHDALVTVVRGVETLVDPDPHVGMIASVERRLQWARDRRRLTIEEPAAAWAEAIASIVDPARSPGYHGLTIAPQLDLVPIGRDAHSGLWEFVDLQTGVAPKRGADGKLILQPENGIVFVLIPGGTFCMGAQASDRSAMNFVAGAYRNESPVHRVDLDAFFLAKHEMTLAQWERTTGEHCPSNGLLPANVSWSQCHEVMRRLGMALPTEAQWEYAARAGTSSAWWAGNDRRDLRDAGNVLDISGANQWGPGNESWDDGFVGAAPIASFRANAFGLHDVIGNVWEWCADRHASYEAPVRPGDGLRITSELTYHMLRGGGFRDAANSERSTVRSSGQADHVAIDIGLRPARALVK